MIPGKDTIRLLRFPFSFLLMPVFLFALSQAPFIHPFKAVLSFLILHGLIYPASNGYNSYMDSDEGSIGGLKHPPKPTRELYYTSLLMDLAGLLAGLLVSWSFCICMILYITASRAYSFKGIRLKKYPLTGFFTVIFFQGAFTFVMTMAGITGENPLFFIFENAYPFALIACSALLAGIYPLTQVYQHQEDKAHGDLTLSLKLGYRGTFIFSSIMFILAGILFFIYFRRAGFREHFLLLCCSALPVLVFFLFWTLKVFRGSKHASFENTMRMNLLSAICLNIFFLVLFVINHLL